MNIGESNWALAGLKEDPFSVEAGVGSGADLRWADMLGIRQRFDGILIDAMTSPQKQVILNSGPWGGGKTFAAEFFSIPANLPHTGNDRVREVVCVVVRTPKAPDKAEQIFYRSVLERVGFERVQAAASSAIDMFGEGQVRSEVLRATTSEDLSSALIQLGKTKDADLQLALRTYFLENRAPRTDLRKLGVARNILAMEDRFGVLAGALRLLIGLGSAEALGEHSRVMLWIDEVEDLVLYPVKYYRPFTQAIRDLLGKMQSYFSLIMNFTLASPEALEDIGVVLGGALLSRVTERVDFKPLSLAEAYEYAVELLNHYRPDEWAGTPEFPFSVEGLEAVLKSIPGAESTPRGINKRCRALIVAALHEGRLPAHTIDSAFVARYESDLAEAV